MKYRKLNHYKYSVMEDCTVQTNIVPSSDLVYRFMTLFTTGQLLIKQGYAWDGATGLPITPKDMMRGSLVHDVLYQLMRLGDLDYKTNRVLADEMLRRLSLEDGANFAEANCIYEVVRLFGESFAKPTPAVEVAVFEAP
jgi:hypothetical protein